MGELGIRMDPLNPGHFFACCGVFELIGMEQPAALAWFVVDPHRPRLAECVIETPGTSPNLSPVLRRLKTAKPAFPDTGIEPAIRPAEIPYNNTVLVLDWWLNKFRDDTENLKCWAGQVTTKNLFSELLPLLEDESLASDLFERPRMTKAKFGVDPRSAWNALDFGFSPNEHGRDSATFPAVEIMAAIGLQGFRPNADRRDGVRYCLWRTPLPPSVARLAFRAPWDGLPRCEREFSIAKRGQSYKYFTFAVDTDRENI